MGITSVGPELGLMHVSARDNITIRYPRHELMLNQGDTSETLQAAVVTSLELFGDVVLLVNFTPFRSEAFVSV
jgi:hypothetical protein